MEINEVISCLEIYHFLIKYNEDFGMKSLRIFQIFEGFKLWNRFVSFNHVVLALD